MQADADLITQALAAVREHGLEARLLMAEPMVRDGARADARIELGHGALRRHFTVEVMATLRPENLGPVAYRMTQLGDNALLVTRYVPPALADALKQHGIAFLDTAGNACIDRAPLFVWVKGQRPVAQKKNAPAAGRAFQRTGLQVLFALLCDPGRVNLPYRQLAAMAGTAHGTVGWVMADLQQLGHLREVAGRRGHRRLDNLERLLNQWVDAYARVLRPRTLIQRYYVATIADWKDWDLEAGAALWGGEPAAARLTGYLRPGELTLYAEQLPAQLALRHKFKRTPEPGHMAVVDVRKKFWHFAAQDTNPGLAPPLLVYADLLATGEARCIETARLIHEAHVARLFREA